MPLVKSVEVFTAPPSKCLRNEIPAIPSLSKPGDVSLFKIWLHNWRFFTFALFIFAQGHNVAISWRLNIILCKSNIINGASKWLSDQSFC